MSTPTSFLAAQYQRRRGTNNYTAESDKCVVICMRFSAVGFSPLPEISGISIVMYVSELFVHGECIIHSLAGPWKKLGVLGGDDLKNNNDDLKPPKNDKILVAPPSE